MPQSEAEFALLVESAAERDTAGNIAYFTIEIILGLIAILTSGTLLFIIARSPRLRSVKLFTLVGAQAVPDLIFGVFMAAESIVALSSGYPKPIFSSDLRRAFELCQNAGIVVDFTLFASILTYLLVAYDRWRNLVPPSPRKHHRARQTTSKLSQQKFLQLCAANYVVAVACAMTIRFAPSMGMGVGPSGLYCHADFDSATTCLFVGACIVLPMMILAALYYSLFKSCAATMARVRLHSNHELRQKQEGERATVARRMVAIVAFFVLCWSPATVMIIARTINALSPGSGEPLAGSPELDIAAAICCTFQTAFNAALSIALFPPLRKELWSTSVGRRLMSCCLCLSRRMQGVSLFASDVPLDNDVNNPMILSRASDDFDAEKHLHAVGGGDGGGTW